MIDRVQLTDAVKRLIRVYKKNPTKQDILNEFSNRKAASEILNICQGEGLVVEENGRYKLGEPKRGRPKAETVA